MIGADNPVFIVKAQRQRHAAMGTNVPGDHHLVVNPVDNQLFIKQSGFNRSRADVARPGNRVPAFCQTQPVLWLKRAMGWWRWVFYHGCHSCVQPNGPP